MLRGNSNAIEPPEVKLARETIKAWKGRHGHSSYVNPLDGGHTGYQAACWDCDWLGPEHLRGDEEIGTPESRSHKMAARTEAFEHQRKTAYEYEPPMSGVSRATALYSAQHLEEASGYIAAAGAGEVYSLKFKTMAATLRTELGLLGEDQ